MFFSQDRADIRSAVNELCQRMSDPSQRSFSKLKRFVRYLKEETMDPSFRTRGPEFRSGSFLGLRLGWRQRNEEIVKREGRARGTTLFGSETKKTEDLARSSADAVCSSIGSVRSEVICDFGFVVELALIIDAKQQNTFSIDTNRQNETHRRGAFVVAR